MAYKAIRLQYIVWTPHLYYTLPRYCIGYLNLKFNDKFKTLVSFFESTTKHNATNVLYNYISYLYYLLLKPVVAQGHKVRLQNLLVVVSIPIIYIYIHIFISSL